MTSQLPLPSSSSSRTFLPPTAALNKPQTLNIPKSPTSSAISSSSLHDAPPPFSAPSLTTTFPSLQRSSSTHAGGIQPSASFFHPSKPSQQPYYSRPSSIASVVSADDPGHIQLEPLSKQISNGSDDPSTTDDHHHQHRRRQSSRRYKHSREPLLPFAPRTAAQPSFTPRAGSPTQSSTGPGTRVQTSFDRILRRRMSLDSSGTNLPLEERKLSDLEQAFGVTPSRRAALRHHIPPSADPSSFNPVPPPDNPPLSAVPMKDPVTGKWLRNYEVHPSRNKFFFGGRMLTGGDSPWAFIASSFLVLAIAGVWFSTTCVWWWLNESPAVALVGSYMCLLTISSMIVTATRDPGILPRNLDPNPPYPATSPSDGGVRAPMPRDLKVRSDIVRVKYCPTCKTYRPPRSSHCKMCDNCVDGCDHHCQWVNNCVGRRNYTSFFAFLSSATITLVLIICTSALHIYLLTRKDHINFVHALQRAPGSVVVFCLSISVVWPVAALLSYHMRLLLLNITTIEQIRNQAHKTLIPGPPPPNPFSHGSWRRNLMAVMCRPVGYSYLSGHEIAKEDKREVNPGMLGGHGKGKDDVT